MAKIKQKINIDEETDSKIRRSWDRERNRWYFSVTDIIGIITDTVDSRNYWKVLKNRLKTSHRQLVTDFNQLKMPASDGKKYLVDAADGDTIIKLLEIIAPQHSTHFRNWLVHLEVKSNLENKKSTGSDGLNAHESDSCKKISTDLEISIDVFENKNQIIIKTILPGVSTTSLLISVSMNTVNIKGELKNDHENLEVMDEDYFIRELIWGKFERVVKLENLVDVDTVEATEHHGLITITLNKIDLEKTRFIKIKSFNN